ncbi:MAG: 4Fe-4S dicluster domain-containing protein [Lentisphaerae bacterium]|nr:4Fe-4S dicluster domain-containing protein [Lentisphaerota bacterium]
MKAELNMIINNCNGTHVSMLGLGMMRLPCIENNDGRIDEVEVCRMVDYAIEHGVNYFDTAWMYHRGTSEEVSGRCLNRHKRSDFLLASKFPGQLPEAVNAVEKTFETQIARSNVGYFDFYLLHNVYEQNLEFYLDDAQYGIVSYLLKQKAAGRIRHLGFSTHGTLETMKKFLDRYADVMEFCQIQLNYLDWHLQDAEQKIDLLKSYDIPIWVMEPLRGGALAQLDDRYADRLRAIDSKYSIPEWSFRFLQSIPEVKVVLSGMSNMLQLEENVRIFSERKVLPPDQFKAVIAVGDRIVNTIGVPCTACCYCMDKCPRNLSIPSLLARYNEYIVSKDGGIVPGKMNSLPEEKRPGACIGCRNCEKLCPQQIKISEILKDFAGKLT